ncbi:asparagine synthase (glutamine-hydrolyzing) [Photobacterium carnosum]|uniref:asparagine synthase (glutamine-hydrolyzing) n=1 Tax=Photobacterium carnosum TaxID=2023717 RepID=UPI001F487502|nr:asparagine synthase (glutamine-hydrolyzing) [Photobacterium carnosum]MCF2155402.1 asparagine synthase (glutamine-hydrolyzing) [Photobacterium carnosum]MCF2217222.1 asparagine synthase (glutamine-hydrolyzing) [Photobacterium carnosum]
MCGFTGFISFSKKDNDEICSIIKKMNDTLSYRGPDSDGFWFNYQQGLALGHRRLAIQDLSPAGHQPMLSSSGRYQIVFNGEIYNHLDLRAELEKEYGYSKGYWNGHSDTETLLSCFDKWGIRETTNKMVGMFSIALWDNKNNSLSLIRDRLGEKPLYYGWQGDTFLFGSELKALKKHPKFKACINRGALALYLRYNNVPSPYSIYENIFKLSPGKILTLTSDKKEVITEYWSVPSVIEKAQDNIFTGTANDAVDCLQQKLSLSIEQQMLSDVSLGAFLSGGVDSSTVVSMMQSLSTKPIKTFTIGFEDKGYNEAVHAKSIAKHLNTEHTELYITPTDAQSVIPSLSSIYDEPFADVSQIPTILVSQLAKQKVTVSLSGDGGDELFAGYNRHNKIYKTWPKLQKIPLSYRCQSAKLLKAISPKIWDSAQSLIPSRYRVRQLGDKIHKSANVLGSSTFDDLYLGLISQFQNPSSWLLAGDEIENIMSSNLLKIPSISNTEVSMALDMMMYLPDDVLTKVDRAAMSQSLETRVPMLDHRIVEFAWSLPLDYKLRDGQSKWILKKVLERYIPQNLIDRPKMGFSVPIDSWLRGPLYDWVESLINEERLYKEGYFKVEMVRQLWKEHLSCKFNHQYQLWTILMFQQWLNTESDI